MVCIWVDFCVSELAVQRQGAHEFKSKIVLERRGTLEFPVEVLVKLSNGKVIRRTWSSKDPAITWEIAEQSPVASVMIDPAGKVAPSCRLVMNERIAKRLIGTVFFGVSPGFTAATGN